MSQSSSTTVPAVPRVTPPTAGAASSVATAPAVSRPAVLSLSIKEKSALAAAYMPFVRGGGLFIPTTRPARLGDDVYALVTLIDDPNKVPIPGKIIWITPAGTPGRAQGIGIQFTANDAGEQAKIRIESLIGSVAKGSRASHTV